jgi:hypothetical protein
MSDELLTLEVFDTLLHAQVLVSEWRDKYNHYRPHSALGMISPPSTPPDDGPPNPNPDNAWTSQRGPVNSHFGAPAPASPTHQADPSLVATTSDKTTNGPEVAAVALLGRPTGPSYEPVPNTEARRRQT